MENRKKREKEKTEIVNILVLFLIILFYVKIDAVTAAQPYGANYTQVKTETAPLDSPQSVPAQAGNVTELNIFGFSTTQSWQGYFGNVTGTIQLADASDRVMYNWSLASPEGEVYASTNGTGIQWTNTQCFNFTADGSYAAESGTGGTTNLYGTNLSQLEARFSIADDDVDGVSETFTLIGSGHDLFYTANQQFDIGECRNTRIFNATGVGGDNQFEEVLLYEPVSASVIFTAILDENALGFDNSTHDFEMLVLEDGHNTDTQVTPYFFYVELQ